MSTGRRIYQCLHSMFRLHHNNICNITCRVGSSPTDFHIHLKTTNRHVLPKMSCKDSTEKFSTKVLKQSKANCLEQASSFGDNLLDLSARDMLHPPNHTLHNSHSWDSLVKPEQPGEPMDATMNQSVMMSSIKRAEGSKHMSSREKFLRQCVSKRQSEFTDLKHFTLFCGSWNVNSKSPPDDLKSWLLVDDEAPEMFALGFQELDTSKEAFLFMDSPKETEWLVALSKCLFTKTLYIKVKSIRLVGLLLVVYVQEKLAKYVAHVDVDTVPTGVMGIMGDKGAASVRLNFHNTSLCFINSHLAAHQAEVESRNMDYKNIMSKTKFKNFDPPQEIADHDLVFWLGDLNYRIDLPIDDVKSSIKKRDYARLQQADQLCKLMKKSEVFQGFNEGVLNFDPTFKFDPGTDTYDTSEKQRIPAWCDRILWSGSDVKQLRLSSHPQLKLSDHKAVSALFKVGIQVIDPKRYKQVYEEVMQKLDWLDTGDQAPHVKLIERVSTDIKFSEVNSQTVSVASVGQGKPVSLSPVCAAHDECQQSIVPQKIIKFVDHLFENGSNEPQCLEIEPCTPDIHQK